jgi:hypothetical protein
LEHDQAEDLKYKKYLHDLIIRKMKKIETFLDLDSSEFHSW